MVGLIIHYIVFFFFLLKRYSLAVSITLLKWIAWFKGKHLIENQLPFASQKKQRATVDHRLVYFKDDYKCKMAKSATLKCIRTVV